MITPDDALLATLKGVLDRDPRNGPLWLHYADLLAKAGRTGDAVAALRAAVEIETASREACRRLVALLRQTGALAEALIRAEKLLQAEDSAEVRLELGRILLARGDREGALAEYERVLARDPGKTHPELEALRAGGTESEGGAAAGAEGSPRDRGDEDEAVAPSPAAPTDNLAEVAPEGLKPEEWASQFEWGDLHVTFADVAGLEDVKQQIYLRIIAPFKQKEIYRAFHKGGGGGILLYGPPGCGKTFIAKATAGECGARFILVGIHDIVDKYWGESEKLLHALFEDARRKAPAVIFFDEFDALGAIRGRSESQFWKTLVDQLLQEMDGFAGRNDDVLVFAATNVPWNVDAAFRRPGRFDRVLFVPPPDEKARREILRRNTEKLPGGEKVPLADLARRTALMTGADIKALAERAADRALSRSLKSGKVERVTPGDFEGELGHMTTSAGEWLATARNYARYANEGGQYDELAEFLKRIKRW